MRHCYFWNSDVRLEFGLDGGEELFVAGKAKEHSFFSHLFGSDRDAEFASSSRFKQGLNGEDGANLIR